MAGRLRTRAGQALICIALLFPFDIPFADEPARLLNAAYINFPPLAYTDADGQPAGVIIELSEELAAASGIRLAWRELPANRIHHYLRTGEIDLWPSSQSVPALSELVHESRPLHLSVKLLAYHLKDTQVPGRAAELLENSQLILIRGYTYRGQLDQHLAKNPNPPIVAPNHQAALALLRKGRGDFLVSFSHPVEELLRADATGNLGWVLLDEWPLTLLVSRETEAAAEVVKALNAAYDRYLLDTEAMPEASRQAFRPEETRRR